MRFLSSALLPLLTLHFLLTCFVFVDGRTGERGHGDARDGGGSSGSGYYHGLRYSGYSHDYSTGTTGKGGTISTELIIILSCVTGGIFFFIIVGVFISSFYDKCKCRNRQAEYSSNRVEHGRSVTRMHSNGNVFTVTARNSNGSGNNGQYYEERYLPPKNMQSSANQEKKEAARKEQHYYDERWILRKDFKAKVAQQGPFNLGKSLESTQLSTDSEMKEKEKPHEKIKT